MPTELSTDFSTVSNISLKKSTIRILLKMTTRRVAQYRRFGSYEVEDLQLMEQLITSLLGAEECNIFIYKSK